jgi:hypothetical protein
MTSKILKFIVLAFPILLIQNSYAQKTIWRGQKITFSKGDNVNVTLKKNQDRITDSVWITRGASEGIYNIKVENSYSGTSPKRTMWAFGKTSNIKSLTFATWETTHGSNPPSMINQDMVLFIPKDSVYIDLVYKQWTQGGGGGFSWERSTKYIQDTIDVTKCDSVVSPTGKYTWYKTGTYSDTLLDKTKQGFDTVYIVNAVIPDGKRTRSVFTCFTSYIPQSGQHEWFKSGFYHDTLVNKGMCGDSVITYILTVGGTSSSITDTVCYPYKSPSGKYTYTSSGVYKDTISNKINCDSVITLNLTINSSTSATINPVECASYTSPSGKYVWTAGGKYRDTIPNSQNCDSLLTIFLTINQASLKVVPVTACNSYTSPSGKYVWTTSGTHFDTLLKVNGCDSIIETVLTINKSSTSNVSISACETYTSPSGKYVWTSSGTYNDTIANVSNCDSFMTINLAINDPTSASITEVACNSYISPSGNYEWTVSNTYMDTIPNSNGCDSVITINLTVNKVDATFDKRGDQFVANAVGATYQWMTCGAGFVPISGETGQIYMATAVGMYGLQVTENGCTDTSECYNHTALNIKDNLINHLIVSPNPTESRIDINLGANYDEVKIELLNTLGMVISTDTYFSSNKMELELDYPAGIYFLRVSVDHAKPAVVRIVLK